jgi:hypothetical protein
MKLLKSLRSAASRSFVLYPHGGAYFDMAAIIIPELRLEAFTKKYYFIPRDSIEKKEVNGKVAWVSR